MGWGLTAEKGKQPLELLRVDVPVVPIAQCLVDFNSTDPLPPTMFCAGGEEDKDSCQGDSGGPIMVEQATGDVLIGLVTSGFGCGHVGFPGIYTKVSYAKDWILSLVPEAKFQ